MRKDEADKIISFLAEAKETMESLHFMKLCVDLMFANNSNDQQRNRVWHAALDCWNEEAKSYGL